MIELSCLHGSERYAACFDEVVARAVRVSQPAVLSALLVIQLFGIMIPSPFPLKSTKRSAAAIIRPQRSFITFHGALRNILLSTGLSTMFRIIASEQMFVNNLSQKIFLGKSQAKNAVLFQQTILRYFVHFGQHEKATRQSPAGSLCFIVLFPCYFRVLCVRFSLKYERTGAARPPPPSTRPAPCSHSARLKPSLGSCSSRFGFA